MSEQTESKQNQKGLPRWIKIVCAAIAVMVFCTCVFRAYEYRELNAKIESNVQFIKSQGFNAERGYFSSFAPFMRISNVTYFLTLARNWNITTMFVDTGDGELFFTYEGLIYACKGR